VTDPYAAQVDETGRLASPTSTVTRRLSHMSGMYADGEAYAELAAAGDPLIYEVFQRDVPVTSAELAVCTTVLQPGLVGDEYFMTKGHFHEVRDRAEAYFGLTGTGVLLLETEDGQAASSPMRPHSVAYVPGGWAHRTVNTGPEPLTFLAVYPGDAGHDYATIESDGFSQRVISVDGSPHIVPRGGDPA
jgi:glucose-6-phosphate isomerase